MLKLIAFAAIAVISTSAYAGAKYKRSDIVAAYQRCPMLGDLENGGDRRTYQDTLDACVWDVTHPSPRAIVH